MKKKILSIVPLPPPVHGAGVVSQQMVGSPKIATRFSVSVVNSSQSRSVRSMGSVSRRRLRSVPRAVAIVLRSLLGVLRRPDIVYVALTVSDIAFLRDSLAIWAAKMMKIPVVLHLHNRGTKRLIERGIPATLIRGVIDRTTILVLYPDMAKDTQRYAPHSKYIVCPNGVPDPFRDWPPDFPGFDLRERSDQTFRVLYLSNLIRTKGVCEAVLAVAMAREQGAEMTLDVVGAPGDVSYDDLMTIAGPTKDVSWLRLRGGMFGNRKLETVSRADVLVFPSYYPNECLPLVILEAMSVGTPVLASREGGIPTIIEDGHNGVLLDEVSSESIAKALVSLQRDRSIIKKFSLNRPSEYSQKYTLESFERCDFGVFQDVVHDEVERFKKESRDQAESEFKEI
jgi:glycosyltransferase involved in cell wall biosynthesis